MGCRVTDTVHPTGAHLLQDKKKQLEWLKRKQEDPKHNTYFYCAYCRSEFVVVLQTLCVDVAVQTCLNSPQYNHHIFIVCHHVRAVYPMAEQQPTKLGYLAQLHRFLTYLAFINNKINEE